MLDLTEMFGEGWCVTLAPLEPVQALNRMGVQDATLVDDGLESVGRRMERHEGPDVLLLGRELRNGWSVVLELEGNWGWAGMDADVLSALSADGRVAVSVFSDPNQQKLQVDFDGTEVGYLDVLSGFFLFEPTDEVPAVAALLAAGFHRLDRLDEPTGQVAAMDPLERAALALCAVTGVELTASDFDGPWLACLSAPSERRNQRSA